MHVIRSSFSPILTFLCGVLALCAGATSAQQFVDQTSTRFPSPNPTEYSNQLTIGDLDGDGDLDIIFGNGGNYSTSGPPQPQRVYINDGTGVFTDESDSRIGFSGNVRGVELGDIERDGDLDVVFVQDFDKQPQLFVNDGSGFFTNETASRLPALTLASSRGQFGDVDNDGDLDLYIVSGAANRFSCGQYRLYINDGDGFFTDGTLDHLPIGPVCNNMDAIFGDIDGDFDLDIRTGSTGTNNSRLYRNDGNGIYEEINTIPGDSSCYSYDFGDLDGDGDLDLLGANAGSGTKELLLRNDGTGSFTDISGNITPNQNQDDNDSKFFDYDDDGDLDLIIARLGGSEEKIYQNDGSGVFAQTAGLITPISDSSLDVMVADLTGDGRLDVVTAQGESGSYQNRIYVNNGPVDTHAPRIVATEALADTSDTEGPYVVRALILDDMSSDRNFFDKGVELHYTVDAARPQTLPMAHSGGQVYRGEIPGIPGGVVEYHVTATDFNGNQGFGETETFTVTGGIPCEDIEKFQARCNLAGTFQSRVKFFDDSHSGETVTIELDGTPHVLNIFGKIAGFQQPSAGVGRHTIELVEPAGCFVPIIKKCAVAPTTDD